MKKQIKNINRFGQGAIKEHIQFFQGVGHRAKGRQKHPYSQRDDNFVRYLIEKFPHLNYNQ